MDTKVITFDGKTSNIIGSLNTMTQPTFTATQMPLENGPCKACGYCPSCGRGGYQTTPLYPYYPNPYQTGPIWQWNPQYSPTYTTGTGTNTNVTVWC